jgi:hypothetical protein
MTQDCLLVSSMSFMDWEQIPPDQYWRRTLELMASASPVKGEALHPS